MSEYGYDAEQLTEAFYNDPVGTVGAVASEAAAQAVQGYAAAMQQQSAAADIAKTLGEVEQIGRERYGADWDSYSAEAATLASAHNLIGYGEAPETIASKLGDLIGTVKQREAKQAADAAEAQNQAWRDQVRNADVSRFSLGG